VTAIEVLSLQLLCSDPAAREGIGVVLLGLQKEGEGMTVTSKTLILLGQFTCVHCMQLHSVFN
jgi:hypothetical protein